jgi:hypothetical protein
MLIFRSARQEIRAFSDTIVEESPANLIQPLSDRGVPLEKNLKGRTPSGETQD